MTTNRNEPGPAWYVFVVAFPAADVPTLTALIRQAHASGDSLGMSVAGKLWQAPQPRGKFIALRAEQINLLSRTQASSFTDCWSRLADGGCVIPDWSGRHEA